MSDAWVISLLHQIFISFLSFRVYYGCTFFVRILYFSEWRHSHNVITVYIVLVLFILIDNGMANYTHFDWMEFIVLHDSAIALLLHSDSVCTLIIWNQFNFIFIYFATHNFSPSISFYYIYIYLCVRIAFGQMNVSTMNQ